MYVQPSLASIPYFRSHPDDTSSIQRDPPPDVEWWDATLLPNKTYNDLDTLGIEGLKIRTDDSPITHYVQHPIPIPCPWDKNAVALKPLKLTKKVLISISDLVWARTNWNDV